VVLCISQFNVTAFRGRTAFIGCSATVARLDLQYVKSHAIQPM